MYYSEDFGCTYVVCIPLCAYLQVIWNVLVFAILMLVQVIASNNVLTILDRWNTGIANSNSSLKRPPDGPIVQVVLPLV